MNGRRLFREYAQSKGREAESFVEVEPGDYGCIDKLITKDKEGKLEQTSIDYKEFVNWIIKNK